jgi:hypothetical protein
VDDESTVAIKSLDEVMAAEIPSLHGPKYVKSDKVSG